MNTPPSSDDPIYSENRANLKNLTNVAIKKLENNELHGMESSYH